MENPITFVVVMCAIIAVSRAIRAQAKARKEEELLERNPAAWKQVKELELAKRDRNRQFAGGVVFRIIAFLLKRKF